MRRHARSLIRVIVLLASVAVILVLAMIWLRGEPFDRDRWRAAANDNEVRRIKMAEDLLRRHELIGRNKDEIVWLLGEPTESDKFQNLCDDLYHLGPRRGLFPIDSEWLCLAFEEDRVSRAEIMSD